MMSRLLLSCVALAALGHCSSGVAADNRCQTTSQCAGNAVCVQATGLCAAAGTYLTDCSTSADCSGYFGGVPLMCASNYCLPQVKPMNGTESGSGIGGNSTSSAAVACVYANDCPAAQSCDFGYCEEFVVPNMDCKVNNLDICTAGETCVGGQCQPDLGASGVCKPDCNEDNNEECSPFSNQCVSGGDNATCSDCDGECYSSIFPGFGSAPVCAHRGPSCDVNAAFADSCTNTTICMMGSCMECGDLCHLPQNIFTGLYANGANISAFAYTDFNETDIGTYNASLPADNTNSQDNADFFFHCEPNTFMNIDARIARLQARIARLALNFGRAANAVAQITGAGFIFDLDSIISATADAQLIIAAYSGVNSNVVVSANGSLTVVMDGSDMVKINDTEATTSANFTDGLTLDGPLNVCGGPFSYLYLPTSNNGSEQDNDNAVLQVSGGLNVEGNLANLTLNIEGSIAAAQSASAQVADNATLSSYGDVLGANSTLTVFGDLLFNGSIFQPSLHLDGDATACFGSDGGADTNNATVVGDVSFGANSTAVLMVNATAYGPDADGSTVHFRTISNCPSGVTLQLHVEGSAAAALASAGGVTLFNYASTTYIYTANFTCEIEVCGSTDAACTPVQNPNVPAPAADASSSSTGSAAPTNASSPTASAAVVTTNKAKFSPSKCVASTSTSTPKPAATTSSSSSAAASAASSSSSSTAAANGKSSAASATSAVGAAALFVTVLAAAASSL